MYIVTAKMRKMHIHQFGRLGSHTRYYKQLQYYRVFDEHSFFQMFMKKTKLFFAVGKQRLTSNELL